MATALDEPPRVDIVSDVVCPWCVIGYRQLARAAELAGVPLEVHWHPFELNPDMPPEGQDLRAHLAAKYGTTPEQSRAARTRLTALGAELGFHFAYRDDMRMVNTFQAHQLLVWAGTLGAEHALKQALFAAYFTDGRDVSDLDVLVQAAERVGLDPGTAAALLADGRFGETVRQRETFWMTNGITGVPAMIFARQHLVVGALGVETYGQILDHLARAPSGERAPAASGA